MTNRSQENSILSLSIQIHLDGLSFFTQNSISKEVVTVDEIRFRESANPTTLLTYIEEAFNSDATLSQSFSKVTVVYANELFSVIPKALFNPDKAADYLKFNTKILSTDYIAHDLLEFSELVTVYVPYTNINNFFFDTFGTFEYYHSITLFVKYLYQQKFDAGKPSILINKQSSYFEIGVIDQKKLLLVNRFDIMTKEDFIYYLLFTIEQLELDPENVPVRLVGDISKNDPFYKIAYTYIRDLKVLLENSDNSALQNQPIMATLI